MDWQRVREKCYRSKWRRIFTLEYWALLPVSCLVVAWMIVADINPLRPYAANYLPCMVLFLDSIDGTDRWLSVVYSAFAGGAALVISTIRIAISDSVPVNIEKATRRAVLGAVLLIVSLGSFLVLSQLY